MENQREKQRMSLAGEYGVASELAKRGYDVSITLGNAKAVDIIISKYQSSIHLYKTIEVKTSRRKKCVTNFFQKYGNKDCPHPDFWVLVYIDKQEVSHFFVFNHEEMGHVQMKMNKMKNWEPVIGVDNVTFSQVLEYKDNWNVITI